MEEKREVEIDRFTFYTAAFVYLNGIEVGKMDFVLEQTELMDKLINVLETEGYTITVINRRNG